MTLLHSLLFGIFLLILAYLGLSNAGGVTSIFSTTGAQSNTIIKTLQGR